MNSIAAYYVLVVSDRAPAVDRSRARTERPSLAQRLRAVIATGRVVAPSAQPA